MTSVGSVHLAQIHPNCFGGRPQKGSLKIPEDGMCRGGGIGTPPSEPEPSWWRRRWWRRWRHIPAATVESVSYQRCDCRRVLHDGYMLGGSIAYS